MNLFRSGEFTLHSGIETRWKIECDALTGHDLHTLASIIARNIPPFRTVEGVPTGGLRLATMLREYETLYIGDPLLIVDDVLTTGASYEKQRAGRDAIGVVLFARGKLPDGVVAVFKMPEGWE